MKIPHRLCSIHTSIQPTMTRMQLFNIDSHTVANYSVDRMRSTNPKAQAVTVSSQRNVAEILYPRNSETWKRVFESYAHAKHNIPMIRSMMEKCFNYRESHTWTEMSERPRVEIVPNPAELFKMRIVENDSSPYIALTNVFGQHEGTDHEQYEMLVGARSNFIAELALNQEQFPDQDDPRRLNVKLFNLNNIERIANSIADVLFVVPIIYQRELLKEMADAVRKVNALPDNDRCCGIGSLCQNELELAYFCIVSIYSLESRGTSGERYSIPSKREFEFVERLIANPTEALSCLLNGANAPPINDKEQRTTKLFMLKTHVLPICPEPEFECDKSVEWIQDCDYSKTLLLSIIEVYISWAISFNMNLAECGQREWFNNPRVEKRVRNFLNDARAVQRYIAYTAPRMGYLKQYASNLAWLLNTYSDWNSSVSMHWQEIHVVMSEFLRYNYSPTLYSNVKTCFEADIARCSTTIVSRTGIDYREITNVYDAIGSCEAMIRFWLLADVKLRLSSDNAEIIDKFEKRIQRTAAVTLMNFAHDNMEYLNQYFLIP